MKHAHKPYPAYKPAGVPWLQQVPEHWDLIPNRGLVRKRKVLVGKRHKEYQLLSLTKQGIIVRDISTGKGKFSADMGTSQEVRKGDLVFCLFDVPETPRTVGLSSHDGMITGAYTVFDFIGRGSAEYFDYYYRALDDRKLLGPLYSGLRNTVPLDRLLVTKTPQPPTDEQHLIVRYLHALDAKVKRYIRTKRKLISVLQEQKQAIIQRAVTRGLDPKAKLKPSGVEWLGDVPKHWEVLRCRFLFREIDKRSVEGKETHLSMSQTLGLVPSDQVENRTLVSESYAGGKLCEGNDLVLNRLKAHLGVFALAPQEGVISPDYSVFRGKRPMVMRYFEQVLRSPDCRHELRIRAKGIVEGFWRLYTDDFNDIFLPVPPVDEQSAILSAMDEELKGVHEAIRRIENEIALMQEYHTRLIADVVTGAVDVRAAAKAMAVETEEALEEEPLSMAAEGEAEYGNNEE